MRLSFVIRAVIVTTLVTLAACGRPPAIERALTLPAPCHLIPASVKAPALITVGLVDGVQPEYAPWAHNGAEKLLFHHLYETLINIDCLGGVRPGLATKWKPEHGGRRWIFELRDDARFWDGTRVTAGDVVRCWQDAITLHTGIDSAQAEDDNAVRVFLNSRSRTVPRELSSRAFAVWKLPGASRWPTGTGAYRLVRADGGVVSVRPVGADKPEIRFQHIRTRDARDLLEGQIDMMVTANRGVIEYATDRHDLVATALPWDRTYVLLSVSRAEELRYGHRVAEVSAGFGDRLALDAVRGDARGYESPTWWEDVACRGTSGTSVQPRAALSGLRRIVYDEADAVARDLAERIISLAATDPSASDDAAAITAAIPGLSVDYGNMVAQGLARAQLILNLRDGDEFAYIVSIPRRTPDACYEASRLIERAPWLSHPDIDLGDVMVPLVDTRPHVIARRDRFGLIVDWFGDVLIVNGR